MLTQVMPIEYVRPMQSGRTKPLLLVCEAPTGLTVETVVKFSGSCDEGVTSLAREILAACLAADLGLPIPIPFLVTVTPEWVATVADEDTAATIRGGSQIAFGSTLVTGQYVAWTAGNRLDDRAVPVAASILVFDAIIQNPDRRIGNPNCLVRGDDLRIFDHELAFTHGAVIGWQPPWVPGGLNSFVTPDFHIFRQPLRKRTIDFKPIRQAWRALSNGRIEEYGAVIPAEWVDAGGAVRRALTLIRDARDNIDGCLAEVRRILG